jgi:hypothetical protein
MGHSTMRAAMITNTPPTSAPEIAERLSKIVENESKNQDEDEDGGEAGALVPVT